MENYLNYIDKFATETDVQTAVYNGQLIKPYVAYIESEDRIDWNTKTVTPDYSEQYLTFKITSDGNINWWANRSSYKTISYSTDSGSTWTEITSSTSSTINVNSGDTIMFKGYNDSYGTSSSSASFSGSTAGFNVEGNIMSLIYGDNFIGKTSFPEGSTYNFVDFLRYCTGLTSVENLILPATTLTNRCYNNMFYGSTNLVTAPELPATTLAEGCYTSMFKNCTSLVNVPDLPATTLGNNCYQQMFLGCTSLVTAPDLPATTLTSMCYNSMFSGCTSLETAPELPATTLAGNCYNSMFQGCTSLNYIKCLATTNISVGTYNWVSGVASTGTFVKAAGVSWSTGNNGIPNGWTVQEV